jgi:hypothetical protein
MTETLVALSGRGHTHILKPDDDTMLLCGPRATLTNKPEEPVEENVVDQPLCGQCEWVKERLLTRA